MNDLKQEIVIDLTVDKEQLNESYLAQFGTAIELILQRMFGLNDLGFKLRGPQSSVFKFIKTLEQEQRYADALIRSGLGNPSALNKGQLDNAVRDFEKTTGIKWPLK